MRWIQRFKRLFDIRLKSLIILILAIFFLAVIAMNFLFYAVSSQALKEQSGTYFSSISFQIQQDIRTNHTFVNDALENICGSEQLQRYLHTGNDPQTHENIADSLKNIAALNDCIETIKIVSDHATISVAEEEPVAMFFLTQEYDLLHIQPEKPFFTRPLLSEERRTSYYVYVYPIRSVELDTFRQYIGTALVLLNLDKELANQESGLSIPSTACMVADQRDMVLYSTGMVDAEDFYAACRRKTDEAASDIATVRYQGETYYFTSSDLSDVNWKILTAVPQRLLSSQMGQIQRITILLSIGSGVLVLVVAALLLVNIYCPIRSMAEDMSKVHLGDRELRIQSPSHNELGDLAYHINGMLDALQDSAREIIHTQNNLYQLELAEKKSQMLALQSQINPHFLYNTLECIQAIAVLHHVPQIATITSSMAKIFRYAIGQSGTSPLSDELTCVQHYLNIMRIRFDCEARLELEIPEEYLRLPVLRMTLQPIVENAFAYGLEKNGGEGYIRITAQRHGNRLWISIYNSGNSLTAEAAQQINQALRGALVQNANINGGLALINIQHRLRLYGGPDSGIRVSVTEDGLACFTLVFPFPEPAGENPD